MEESYGGDDGLGSDVQGEGGVTRGLVVILAVLIFMNPAGNGKFLSGQNGRKEAAPVPAPHRASPTSIICCTVLLYCSHARTLPGPLPKDYSTERTQRKAKACCVIYLYGHMTQAHQRSNPANQCFAL